MKKYTTPLILVLFLPIIAGCGKHNSINIANTGDEVADFAENSNVPKSTEEDAYDSKRVHIMHESSKNGQ